ncbi:Omega-hydroxypalmitate O-feruloyl transferase [Platanthera zijinensis]|uniref:Omega-hydroxypalmitate O-feruloyl transferase n=1 Tax=Platanthera zijinensis TaxID=2320716 RepID=A0AAP0B179_9ASPA
METLLLTEQNVKKSKPITLFSPSNPAPMETLYLSNIDQTVAFNVETVFFYEVPEVLGAAASDIVRRVRLAVSEVLLVPYYFMAGRLRCNLLSNRLELVCNNKGVLFTGATASLRLKELGNLSFPNPSFQNLILSAEESGDLSNSLVLSIQVTRFRCGGFSIGFVINHSILDGRSAAEMMLNLASICRGEGMKIAGDLDPDRSCIRARNPPQIKFQHTEYSDLPESSAISFTSPVVSSPAARLSRISNFNLFCFDPDMIKRLKEKSGMNCSSFEAMVAHIWIARTKAVFVDRTKTASVLFAVDIRNKMSPPLPRRFIGNAVITATASARADELSERGFSFGVGLVRGAIERVDNEYVRSVIDWLEVHKGVPSVLDGNFFVSAWWKLPFHELDFGYGKPVYGGPVLIGGKEEFVLLLSDCSGVGKDREGGINVWIALEQEKMLKFHSFVFQI